VQDRHVGERFRATGDRDVDVAERYLVGGVSYRLVGRGARAADRERLHSLGQLGEERHLAGDVGSEHGGNDGAEHERLDFLSVQVGALQQLGDAKLAQIDGGQRLERRSGFRERRSYAGDDRYPATVPECSHRGNLDGGTVFF
jgi:hypothetical protein